jgi:hypothetical protein
MTTLVEHLVRHIMDNMAEPRHATMREQGLMFWRDHYGQKFADDLVKGVEAAWFKKGLPGAPFPLAGLLSQAANTGEANAHLSR